MRVRVLVRVQDVFHDEIRDRVAAPVSPALIPGGYIEGGYLQICPSFSLSTQDCPCCIYILFLIIFCLVCDHSIFTSISLSFESGILVYLGSPSFNLY